MPSLTHVVQAACSLACPLTSTRQRRQAPQAAMPSSWQRAGMSMPSRRATERTVSPGWAASFWPSTITVTAALVRGTHCCLPSATASTPVSTGTASNLHTWRQVSHWMHSLLVDDVQLLTLAADGADGAGVEADVAARAGVLVDGVADERPADLGRAALVHHVLHDLVAEVAQRGEHGVRGAAAELAERPLHDVVGELLEALDVLHGAFAGGDALEDLEHALSCRCGRARTCRSSPRR